MIAPETVQCPFLYKTIKISTKYTLYSHIDLNVTVCSGSNSSLILIGDIFDFENPGKSNIDILQDLIHFDLEKLLESVSKYAGRFVMIFSRNDLIYLFHDATATRKVYYYSRNRELWFASQPHLLANILKLKSTSDVSKVAYYHSQDLASNFNGNIGDTTWYDEVKQLLPNHYITEDGKITRYWPNSQLETRSLKFAAENSASMIRGIIESIVTRYEVMLPVTAGKDSRTLLAASRQFMDRVYLYTNRMMAMNNTDIVIPMKLLSDLKLNFNIIDPYIPVDEEFKKVYFQNNPFASPHYLPVIYNYHIHYPGRVNLPGNSVADQEYIYNMVRRRLTAEDFITLSGFGKYEFAASYFTRWYDEAYERCLYYTINPMSLFYWENRLSNSIQQIQIDKDIAQEEFSPFNSRQLISYYLSVKPKHNISPDYRLHREIMKNLWPIVLKVPINPSRSNAMKSFFKTLGLLRTAYTLKHSFSKVT